MNEINPCQACKKRLGNDGLPRYYASTESDVGGYYRSHVRCEQCRRDVRGNKTMNSALSAWNRSNPKQLPDTGSETKEDGNG